MSKSEFYIRIRKTSRKERIIFLSSTILIILLPFLVIVSISSERQETRSNAAEISIDSLNTELLDSNRVGDRVVSQSLLERRKALMTDLAYDNPTEFLNKAMNSDTRNSFPESQRSLIEERTQLTGTLVPYHSDNFETGTTKTNYFVQSNDSTISVSFDSVPEEKNLELAENISISGYKIGDHIVARKADLQVLTTASETTSTGNKSYVVLPINFTDDRSTPRTKAEMLKTFFCIPSCNDSLKTYFRKQSDNKINISGQVTNSWIESPFRKNEVCNSKGIDKLLVWARSRVPLAFVDSNDGIIFVYSSSGCEWPGMGTVGGNPSISWIVEYSNRVIAHELGHNLRLHHASRCDAFKDPICNSTSEYGDNADPMGNSLTDFNGPNLRALGVLPNSAIVTTVQGGTFTVNKLEGNTSPRLIRVNIPDTDANIYVEFRGDRTGYDTNSSYKLGAGVLLHSWNNNVGSRTYLYNFFNQHDPVLRDGETVLMGGYKIKQLSHNNNSARVRITKQ